MELIDRKQVIEILEALKKKQAECGCKGSSERAIALGYAIEIVKKVETVKNETR